MNDNLQYKSRSELEQLCKQFNIQTLGLKKEDLLIELRCKLLWVNDLPRSPHRPHRSAEGIASSKKKRSTQKVFSKSASMGRTVSHLQDQFEEQADPAWSGQVVRAVSGLGEDDNTLKEDANISRTDSNGLSEVKTAVTKKSMGTEEEPKEGTNVSIEETITGTDASEAAHMEAHSLNCKSGKRNGSLDSTEENSTPAPVTPVNCRGDLEGHEDTGYPTEPQGTKADSSEVMSSGSSGEKPIASSDVGDTEYETSEISNDDDIVFEYPGMCPSFESIYTSAEDFSNRYPPLEDKEVLHHVARTGSLGSGWANPPFSQLRTMGSMTVELGDNPPAESLSTASEAEREGATSDQDISNELDAKDNSDLEDFIEFKIVDNADVYMSLMEDKKLLHQVKEGNMGSSIVDKSPSRLHSMNSMFVEVGDNPPAESESLAGLNEAEDQAAFQDLDTFDGYEVTVVEDDTSPWNNASEIENTVQSAPTESIGRTSPYEDSTEASSYPENSLEEFVHDAHQGSKTTFVSEWAANNLPLSTGDIDKEQAAHQQGESSHEMGFPFSVVLWCSQSCSRLPGGK